jgi:hypothetical protein
MIKKIINWVPLKLLKFIPNYQLEYRPEHQKYIQFCWGYDGPTLNRLTVGNANTDHRIVQLKGSIHDFCILVRFWRCSETPFIISRQTIWIHRNKWMSEMAACPIIVWLRMQVFVFSIRSNFI